MNYFQFSNQEESENCNQIWNTRPGPPTSKSSVEANECAFEFNIPTSLGSSTQNNKRDQESQDPLKYKFDIIPGKMCFRGNEVMQGLTVTSKNPPSNLLDVEYYLRTGSFINEINRDIAQDNNKQAPCMPNILNNQMVISEDCTTDTYRQTKLRKVDMPQYSTPLYAQTYNQTEYSKSGRDTQLEVKDAYKQYRKSNTQSYSIPTPKYRLPCAPPQSSLDLSSSFSNKNYIDQVFPCDSTYSFGNCNSVVSPSKGVNYNPDKRGNQGLCQGEWYQPK
jgi:hypothetical protein